MYQINYQLTHDIDWFAFIDGIPVHIATNGGLLPHDSYKVKDLVRIQKLVHRMERRYKVGINENYLERYLNEIEAYPGIDEMTDEDFRQMLPERLEINRNHSRAINAYIWSFVEMASKGFLSFDRRVDDEHWVDYYHLVAWPLCDRTPALHEGMYHLMETYSARDIMFSEPKDSIRFQHLPLFYMMEKERINDNF